MWLHTSIQALQNGGQPFRIGDRKHNNSYTSQVSGLRKKSKISCAYLQDKAEGRCSTICEKIQVGTEPPTCLFRISKLPCSLISSYLKRSFEEPCSDVLLVVEGCVGKSNEKQFKSMCILQCIVVHTKCCTAVLLVMATFS